MELRIKFAEEIDFNYNGEVERKHGIERDRGMEIEETHRCKLLKEYLSYIKQE